MRSCVCGAWCVVRAPCVCVNGWVEADIENAIDASSIVYECAGDKCVRVYVCMAHTKCLIITFIYYTLNTIGLFRDLIRKFMAQ